MFVLGIQKERSEIKSGSVRSAPDFMVCLARFLNLCIKNRIISKKKKMSVVIIMTQMTIRKNGFDTKLL